jgi:protease I
MISVRHRTVRREVGGLMAARGDFITGPGSARRDGPHHLDAGFTVADGQYLSARWPGDAHRFAIKFAALCRA